MYKNCIKRLLDILLSLTGIILLSWLYLILFILVRVKLGGPAIFTQERPGKNGIIFKLYKFRSMSNERDENGELLPDDRRRGSATSRGDQPGASRRSLSG